ncbi:T9SS type A sorting domain-containing protein [Adhaeribacter sp. BT258]|uniref:T9SS type A sorting domain-containing protein n=1 Tax=Adhaeribacter terrigena TaxID=2793070 RepID=A0ABS1BXM1_9BACT|nr:CARDB domain-containing protein [Adhaeribacter terrigena]MBK0401890.1 T9SS type A sorting domain-containing protein [Adhaeribacter terrigena]
MKKRLLLTVAAALSLQAKAQTYTHATVPVTGFSADVISDGPGTAISSAPYDIDGVGFNLVAQNFVNPANQTPVSYLPTGGLINSAATAGLSFQMAPYNANNSLRITTANNTDTIVFVTPRAAHKINLLITSAYGCTFTATLNFTDGTTETFSGNVVPNWFDGTAPIAIKTIGRVKRADNTIENPANNPRLYQYAFTLNAANTSKLIQSIKFTKTSTPANEILHVFAVSASTLLPNDIGITAISAPTSPVTPGISQPVTVTVKNFGSSPLNTATLGFSINGNTVLNNYAFTASPALTTNAVSTPVTIGNYTFPAGNHTIKAWSSQPNSLPDGAPANDTIQVSVTACNALSGNYTIDKNTPATATNFTSFAAARQILSSCGVSGPVTFTVVPNSGPYNEQVTLAAINGASATNTVTFEGSGNTVSVAPGSTHLGIFTLDGADFVKINNFNITLPAAATTGWGIQLKNNADNNVISNNTVNIPLTLTTSAVFGIVAGSGATSAGNNASNTIIQNNIINGGYGGISINGNSSNGGAVGNLIKDNQIKDSYFYGLYLNNVTNVIIEGNDISRAVRTNGTAYYGVYLSGISIGNHIKKNRVHNTHDAATTKTGTVYLYYCNSSGAVGSENIFSNNLGYNLNNNGGLLYAFYNGAFNNNWFYHNTISADDPAISYSTLRGIWFTTASTNVRVINNNFSLASAATNKYAIYLAFSGIALQSNGNNFYLGTSGKIGYYTADRNTLADWKAVNAGAYDQNSVSVDSYFTNLPAGNLRPNAGQLNNAGVAQTVVVDDLTGTTRSTTNPDPGAYEFVPPATDAGISAILSPNTGCGLTNQETISVTLNNFGAAAQSNIPVSYTINGGTPVTETFAGPLAPGASVTYNFTTKANLSVPNNYTIAAQANLAGDMFTSNDGASKAIIAIPLVTTYPYLENFDTNQGGWIASGASSSWAWGTPAKATINSAASGTKSWVTNLTTNHNSTEKSQVVSPCFNFSGLTAPVIEMKVWWNSDFSNDGAVLQSSIDGGLTWQNVGVSGDPNNWYNDNSINGGPGDQLPPSAHGWTGRNATSNGSGGWVTAKHTLSGLGGQSSVRLRIAFGSDGSTNYDGFAFDDVTIYETPTNDGGVTAIITPNSGCGLTNLETVTIAVKNFGGTTLSNIPVSFKVDGGSPVTEVVAGPIASNTTINYTFAAKANLSVVGSHTIVARTFVPGDNLAFNDSLVKIVTNIPVVSSLPYTEGFENGNGGWLAGGTNSTWALGTPAKTVINAAGAGTKSWVTSLTGTYNAYENSYVVGPCFNFAGLADPDFEMKAWWNSEFSLDGAVLQSSIDGGLTWQNVGVKGDPNNWYNDNTINGGPGGQSAASAHGWSGRNSTNNGSNGWVTVKHRLNGLGGQSAVLLRVAFGSDASGQDNGFAFDEIKILDKSNDLAVNSVVPINKLCGLTNAEPITAVIQNQGPVAASGFTLTYSVNGGSPVTENFTGSLASGALANFTFNQTANLSASGNQNIEVTVNMTGDPNATNNSATYSIANSTFAGLPPVFDFEPAGNGIAQLRTVTNSRSAVVESVDATNGAGSTKGIIMDGVNHSSWTIPTGITDPWMNNLENISALYICFDPGSTNPKDSLLLTFDLKQLYKTANANTNLRILADGVQIGQTYRPPFTGTPISWKKIRVDLSNYQNRNGLQLVIESNVKEPYAAGAGTANLIDNIEIRRVVYTGVKDATLSAQLNVFPNPSNGIFNVELPQGKNYELVVTDLTGKVLKKYPAKGGANQLNLEGTAKGVYLLKVRGEKGAAVRKLIVE